MIFNKLSVVELLMGKGFKNIVKKNQEIFTITESIKVEMGENSVKISTEEGLIVHLFKAVQTLSNRLTELEDQYDTLSEDHLFLKSDYDLDRALACSAKEATPKKSKKTK